MTFHPNYLREWLTKHRCSPQKPKRKARQQDPRKVEEFLTTTYPDAQKKSQRSTPTSS